LFSISVGNAQTTGTIRGRVTDPSGAVVPDANVRALQSSTHVSRGTMTNESGDYELLALPVGRYTVTVQATGFSEARLHEIDVRIGHVTTVDVRLELGQL